MCGKLIVDVAETIGHLLADDVEFAPASRPTTSRCGTTMRRSVVMSRLTARMSPVRDTWRNSNHVLLDFDRAATRARRLQGGSDRPWYRRSGATAPPCPRPARAGRAGRSRSRARCCGVARRGRSPGISETGKSRSRAFRSGALRLEVDTVQHDVEVVIVVLDLWIGFAAEKRPRRPVRGGRTPRAAPRRLRPWARPRPPTPQRRCPETATPGRGGQTALSDHPCGRNT